MSKILMIVFMLFGAPSGHTQGVEKLQVDVAFDKKHVELGKVTRGESRTFQYHFTNTGIDHIEIAIVSGCTCTELDWTRGKIAPGEKGVIDVIFDSTEKEQSETVDVDMYLTNLNPKTDSQYFYILDYDFELIEK